jgi:hypothetical protein
MLETSVHGLPDVPQVSAKVLCAQWTADGQLLAVGCQDGFVTLRDRSGMEKHKLSTGATAVWSLAWLPQVGAASGHIHLS